MANSRRTLMVTDKPSNSRMILPHWENKFPDDVVTLFHTPPMGSFRFQLPRDLPISSVPMIKDPVLVRRSYQEGSPFNGDFNKLAQDADHIVCATDFDPGGCRNFLDLMIEYQIDVPLSDISWLAISTFDGKSIKRDIEKGLKVDNADFARMAAFGQARQYFDYLYILNALPVFGQTLKRAGIKPYDRFSFISKYTLQLLFLLAQEKHSFLKWGDIIKLMVTQHLGSPLSREAIVNWLYDSGCLARDGYDKPERYSLSVRGRHLVSLLHKDCCDPHLCSRLYNWGENWPASKISIERYIKTVFGKQKRYLSFKV